MRDTTIEDYLGAIYRLQQSNTNPTIGNNDLVPLSVLREQFGFSHISIHEMVQKLVGEGLVKYIPYQGVALTQPGNIRARNLIERHQTWERFLIDQLGIAIEEAHDIAHQLEHAAPQIVTERLKTFLKDRCSG